MKKENCPNALYRIYSMSFEIIPTPGFAKEFKTLAKRHRSLKKDIKELSESLQKNPFQGDELCPGIRKIRMAITSKGRGKSGGARVITYTVVAKECNGRVYLMSIYDKSDFSTIDASVVQETIKALGL